MKLVTVKLLIIWISFFLISCGTEIEEIKKITLKDNTIYLKVQNGGATTSFHWNISVVKKDYEKENIIFSSYSLPYIYDIDVDTNNLNIICAGNSPNSQDTIRIDLKRMDMFIDNPVKYYKTKLKSTNGVYQEPDFIKNDRKIEIENNPYYDTY